MEITTVQSGGYRWSEPAVRSADIASLARTPALVRAIVLDRTPEWLDSRHAGDCLSPRETLGHFIYCETNNWIPRVRHILESEEERPFQPFDVFGGNRISQERNVAALVQEFARLRHAGLKQLEQFQITDFDLGKTGLHPVLGPVTLDQLLATWVAHDLYHLGQIFKSFSAPFRSAIGPWQTILNLPQFN